MLSATYSVSDVKKQLERFSFYNYDTEALFTVAIEQALDEAMNDYLIPIIGWGQYGAIRDLDRDLFDDSTCDTTSDDATVTMDDNSNLVADMYVNGAGVTPGSQVDSIDGGGTDFELTQVATADGTNVILTFNRLTDAEYAVYRAETNYSCYSFYMYHARQKLYPREGAQESRVQGGVNISSSGITGPEAVAAKYLNRANIMLNAGGYNTVSSIKRGDSFFY